MLNIKCFQVNVLRHSHRQDREHIAKLIVPMDNHAKIYAILYGDAISWRYNIHKQAY